MQVTIQTRYWLCGRCNHFREGPNVTFLPYWFHWICCAELMRIQTWTTCYQSTRWPIKTLSRKCICHEPVVASCTIWWFGAECEIPQFQRSALLQGCAIGSYQFSGNWPQLKVQSSWSSQVLGLPCSTWWFLVLPQLELPPACSVHTLWQLLINLINLTWFQTNIFLVILFLCHWCRVPRGQYDVTVLRWWRGRWRRQKTIQPKLLAVHIDPPETTTLQATVR